jgi:N-acetylmuramoyl-L-alanine amidase
MRRWRSTAWVLGLAGALFAGGQARALRVVIDPGHGGAQEGAVGAGGLVEKNVALQIAKRLKAQLEHKGAQVLLTRERDMDLPLRARVDAANRFEPDLFISVHANSMPTTALRQKTHGVETFFLSASASGRQAQETANRENDEPTPEGGSTEGSSDTLSFILADLRRAEAHAGSSQLAYAVHQRLVEASASSDRGIHQAPLFVLMGVEAPAILVEVGYISHPIEGKRLKDGRHQEKLAKAVAEGIRAFGARIAARESKGRIASPGRP